MKEKKETVLVKPPKVKKGVTLSHATLMTSIAVIFATGGYGGWEVHKQQGQYGANFEQLSHLIERVPDGDTLVTSNNITVRLLGISAPELDECYGPEVKQALSSMVLGREVRLVKDSTTKDNYGRLLRYAFVISDHPEEDNIFVNDVLIKQGFAATLLSPRDKLYQTLFTNSQGLARNSLKRFT